MKELMLCELVRTDEAAIFTERKKVEFITTVTIRNLIVDPMGDDYILLFVEDSIDEGSAIVSKDTLSSESEWASFIGKTVRLKGFATPSIRANEKPNLFIYSLEEV